MSRRALVGVGLCVILAVGGFLLAKEKATCAKANEPLTQRTADPNELSPELQDKVQEVLQAPTDWEMHRRCRSLFEAAGTEGLRELKLHQHDGIALQAAWEEVLRTIPEKESESTGRPDWVQVNCFLDFMEHRGLEIPGWWKEMFQVEIGAQRRDNIWFRMSELLGFYHEAGLGSIRAPKDTTLERLPIPGRFISGFKYPPDEGATILKIGQESVTLPDSIAAEIRDRLELECISGLILADKCYLAIHSRQIGRYSVVCFKCNSDEILWRTQVSGSPFLVSIRGGLGDQWVSLTQQKIGIVVFGVTDMGAYVEAFDAKDGKNLFRFCTSY
jgi:hypothetical protein